MDQALAIVNEHARLGAQLRQSYLEQAGPLLVRAARLLTRALAGGGKILICGNGGSAADAQHFAAELVGRYLYDRPALPALALTVDSSILTAVANDFGYEQVFARQVQALGLPGDVLVAISTSGNSPSVLRAIDSAVDKQMSIIGLTGQGGGQMAAGCACLFRVPSVSTPLIQETHSTIIHLLCRLIDYYLFENAAALNAEGEENANP